MGDNGIHPEASGPTIGDLALAWSALLYCL
jgi:hypothetical protein